MATDIDEFGAVLVESMDDAIRSLLSQEVVDAFRSNLRNKRSISPEEIPDQLPTVSMVLRKYFGPSAQTIENAIAKTLYSKYGFEFQKSEDYHLVDYVENARNRLKTTPAPPRPEPANVNLPLKDDFNPLLVESVKEAIEDAVGKEQAKLAFRFIERDVTFEKLPNHLPTFYLALKKNFGNNCGTIETAIARKLYQKLSLEFTETPNTELAKYVEAAFIKISQREQQGFVNISDKMERQ